MFKKRLKGLLAMLLAATIALTALPLTASAEIQSISVDSDDYSDYKNQILNGTCSVGPFESNCTQNNLWAYYADTTESGEFYLGSATGNSLGSTLRDLDNKKHPLNETLPDNHNVYLRYSHDVVFLESAPNVYDTYDSGKEVSITDFSEDAQTDVATIAKDLGFVTPLQSVSSWTAYYGYTNGLGTILDCSATGTPYTISETPKITQEIISGLYSGNDSMEDFFKYGAVFIVPEISYKTFNIPVYNALLIPETDEDGNYIKYSITQGVSESLDAGKQFYLCYDKQAIDGTVTTVEGVWNKIAALAEEKGSDFDGSKLKLLRYAKVYVRGGTSGEFTSGDYYNYLKSGTPNDVIKKTFVEVNANSIWKISGYSASEEVYTLQGTLAQELGYFLLRNSDETQIYLNEQTSVYVTGEVPSVNGTISSGSYFTSPLLKNGSPATMSDHVATLTANKSPDSGKKYDATGWQLWKGTISAGFQFNSQIAVGTGVNSIGIEQLEAAGDKTLIIYFPQVVIAPAVEVTAPVVSETPSSEYTIKDTIGGYTVADVSWYDGETKLTSADKFEAGKQYTVKITLSAPSKFTEDTIVTINGEEASTELCENGDLIAAYTYDIPATPIAIAEIIIDEPTLNGVPDTTFDKHSDAPFTASAASWSPAAEKFVAEKAYTVTATLTPDEGYGFTNNTVFKINGKTVTPTNKDGIWSVSYTFDELKAEPWWDIDEILNGENPTITIPADNPKIPQSVLEKIKNSGKTVTIIYDNGYSWEIDGSTIDLSKVPAGGVDLSIVTVDPNDWATVVNKVTGHKYRMQIDIAHEGDFGFTAILTVSLTEGMRNAPAGTYYANLYQVIGNRLVWSGYSPVTQNENGEWIAKLQFTHASEWLITIDNEINPSTGNSSSSGGSSYRPVTETKAAKTAKSEGWSNITNEIKAAQTGSTIEITLNDDTTIPEEALQAAIDNKVKLVIDAGLGRTWTIDGAKAVSGKYIDLTVSGASVDIPAEAYKNIPCSSSNQLIINSRMLNFTAQVSDSVGKNKAGQNAAIYLYNEETGRLLFQELSVVDEDGNITFNVYCGGRYFIALGSEVNAENYLCGDANGDGVVDIFDASAILKNDVFGSVIDKRCADTNCDGKVNVFDASLVLKYVVEIVKALPVSAA